MTCGSSTTAARTGRRRKNLAKEMPEKLHELQRLWLIEAVKYNVLPLDDRQIERFVPELAGRPTLIKGNTQTALRRHGTPVREQRRQHQEQVVRGDRRSRRAGEGRRGRDHRAGRPIRRLEPLRQGRQGQVRLQRARHQVSTSIEGTAAHSGRQDARCAWSSPTTAAALARAAPSRSYCDGKEVGKGRVEQTQGFVFSADETTDIGYESGTTVSPDYTAHTSRFNGEDQLGADRPRQGRRGRRPLHLAGRAPPRRDGAAVGSVQRTAALCRAAVPLHRSARARVQGDHHGCDAGLRVSAARHRPVAAGEASRTIGKGDDPMPDRLPGDRTR